MALLKDTLIQGSARVTDTLYANTIQGNLLKADELQSPLISLYTTINNASNTSQSINLYTNNTLRGHIGISDSSLGIYSTGKILLRPGGGSFATDKGIEVSTTAVIPYSTAGTGSQVALGTTDYRWNGVYSSTGNFSGAVSVDTLTIANTSAAVHLAFSRSSLPNYIGIPDGGTLIVSNNNVLDYPAAALAINKSAVYSGMKGTLGNSTYPWGKIFIKGYQYLYADNTRYPLDTFLYNGSGTQVGEFWYDTGDATNVTGGTYYWRQYSPKATADTGTSGYYETFYLPSVTAARTDNGSYGILTTKSTVTVSQGGTGATSFTANSLIMSGNTTTAALTTRAIYDRTTIDALSAAATWSNSTSIPTMNTLAYWDGRYQTTSNYSNLAYCNKGAFGNAVTYGVDDATANGALGTGTGLTTERSVYYGLVTVNNASQTRATGIYAPTSAGTANQILVSSGGTSAPTWKATAKGAAYATSSNGALTFGLLPIAQGGTEASSAANARANLDVSARIGTGTINLPNYLCMPGFLTDSKKQLRFSYYAGGEINASSATISGNCYIIGVNGKMVGSTMTQTNDAIAITSCGTITLTINKATRSIQIYINDSGGFKNSTNNTPVIIVSYGLKITLS